MKPPNDHRMSLAVTYLDHLQHWAMQKATAVSECEASWVASLLHFQGGALQSTCELNQNVTYIFGDFLRNVILHF